MASVLLQRRAASSAQTGAYPVHARRRETMRLSRRFAGPLLAALMAVGATAATAMPASAATVAPYFRIGVAPQGSSFLRCLQGNLGGPWARPLPSSPVIRTSRTRASCGCRLPWAAISTSSRTSAPAGAWKPATAPSTSVPSTCGPASPPRATNAGTGRPPPPPAVPRSPGRIRSRRESPAAPGSASTSRGADHVRASAADLALQRHAGPAILGRPVATGCLRRGLACLVPPED